MSQRLANRLSGTVRLKDPSAYLSALCAHARAYAEVETGTAWARIDLGYAAVEVKHATDALRLSIRATDSGTVATLQAMMTEHLRETAGDPALAFAWAEAPPRAARAYRTMEVVAVQDITPRMRRFTLSGAALAPFAAGGLHVSLFFPGAGALAVPQVEESGRITWPGEPPPGRVYTIRSIDVATGLVEIDMLLHPSYGVAPGADFARDAKPGAVIGMAGPGGGQLPRSRWVLMLGDETALPAIARSLETLSPEVTAIVRIEVTDGQDELPLASPARLDLCWLHRHAVPAARSRLLLQALAEAPFDAGGDRFVWFAAEAEIARQAKAWLRSRADLAPADYLAAGFWRAED